MINAIKKSEYMRSLFRYIENNISADLEAEFLSGVGYVSCRKLYYDFYSLSGHSIKEYVRKRRLSNALALIKTSDMEFTDIALGCGYSSHQALCRAVRQALGMPPSEYKNSELYYFFPPFNGEPVQSVVVSKEAIPRTIRILFYHSRLTNIEDAAVNTFLQVFPNYGGRIFGRNGKQSVTNGKQKISRFCYELYLTDTVLNYDILLSHGFETAQETPGLSSVFTTTTIENDECKINAAWNYLYSEWLQNSMYEYTDEPYYEEYILRNGKPVKLKLFLPIRKRSEDTKITLIGNPELHFIAAKARGNNAEERASRTMVDYLTTYYPHIINNSKNLFIQKESNSYMCGIRINPELPFIEDENIVNITTDQNNYLVLESSVMGDYDRYSDMLFSFTHDNGMDADKKGVFMVYDVKNGSFNPEIKMYCPIKICRK